MKSIDTLTEADVRGKKVLVRAGLDVPLNDKGEVADLFRVRRAVPTLKFLMEKGARVIIISHIGRDPKETNASVAAALRHHLPVSYVPDLLGVAAKQAVEAVRPGEILLLENLRVDERETGNDEGFARELAAYGDIYVNDAFSASHRAHASLVSVPKFLPHYAGLLLAEEVAQLEPARAPESPSFAVLGGAKFETKAPLIRSLLEHYDHVFITGALANDVFKAKGLPVGISTVSAELPGADVLNHPRFIAPVDVTVELPDGQARVKKPEDVQENERIVDIGPDTVALIAPFLSQAKFILWNGPTGLYEHGFVHYVHAIAEVIAKSSARKVIGGGDTLAVLDDSGVAEEQLGFLSTGGGAMLEYLLDGTLPGIDALR
jgi:phosphoglycerate kinase